MNWIKKENGPLKENIWINSKYEITVTKYNEYRLWDSEQIETIGIFETLKQAMEAAK